MIISNGHGVLTTDEAAKRIKNALKNIRNWSLDTRLQWLKALDEWLVKNKDLVLKTVAQEKKTCEHGILINEYVVVRLLCKYYLSNAKKILRDEDRSRPLSLNFGNKKVVIRKEPLGVVGVISPHNHPLSLPIGAVISALVGGNGVILKTASDTPKTGELVAKMVKTTLGYFYASGIFERLTGKVGMEVVECSLVKKIHFTGSSEVGHQIAQKNAEVRLTPPTLELGGSNPAIVLEDADIKGAAQVLVWARFASMSCNNIKRVFVVAPIYAELYQEVKNLVKQLQKHELAPTLEKEIGNYSKFFWNYLMHTDSGMDHDNLRLGEPRVLRVDKPTEDLLVLKEETFVSLLPIVKVKDETEAVEWANKTPYGLGASVFTKNKKRFERIANQLECGSVLHNDAMTEFAQIQAPFGGWKDSGHGSSHAPEGLLEFVRLKTVITERWPAPKLQLFPWTKGKMKWLRKMSDWIVKMS